MKIIAIIKKSPQAAVLELISIAVTIIFITSLAGTWFGIAVFAALGLTYESQKVWIILEVKKHIALGKGHVWAALWRSFYLAFLIAIALLASLSYSLSTIEAQTVKMADALDTAIPDSVLAEETRLTEVLLKVNLELDAVSKQIAAKDVEIGLKLNQIKALPSGWISASDRLSASIESLEDKKQLLLPRHIELTAKSHIAQSNLDKVTAQKQGYIGVIESKFGAIASEEFTRVSLMLGLDPSSFLEIFMLALLAGVEFGIILLMKPDKVVKTKPAPPAIDPAILEMNKVIDGFLSKGQGKLVGSAKASELSGVSLPRVSAYRTAFIQHGFIKCTQGASSSIYAKREFKEKAKKIRSQIDL